MRWLFPCVASLALCACDPGIIGGSADPSNEDDNPLHQREGQGGQTPAGRHGDSGGARGTLQAQGGQAGGMTPATGGTQGAGGKPPSGSTGGNGPSPDDPSFKTTIMAVGYGGIRVVSQNGGVSWTKVAQLSRDGGDDQQLLRSVAYGNGRWISAGWRMFTSTDGKNWIEGSNPDGCGLMEGAAFGNGIFVGTCGDDAYTSRDGLSWQRAGTVGNTAGHSYVLFGNGKFVASGDSGASYISTNGQTWTVMAGINEVHFCDGEFRSKAECPSEAWFPNQHLRGAWKGKIERSTNGTQWTLGYTDDWDNTVYRFAVGLMPALP